jgi:hypothetical protein
MQEGAMQEDSVVVGNRTRTLSLQGFIHGAALLALVGLTAAAPPPAPPAGFGTADAAVSALVQATQADDATKLLAILGPGSASLVHSGDATSDAAERHRFLDAYNAKHELVPDGDTHMVLHVGQDDWPLPIPLVRQNGTWTFDFKQGAEEIVNRRIGRDEIEAIRVCLAYVDAQQAYFELSQQATGKAVYAQRLVSTEHNYDGLYWPSAANIPVSPFAALVAQAQEEGYPGELVAGKPTPYHGYFFRILTAQGTSAPDGARNYLQNGRMTGGFALVAWPASYAASGIMTFVIAKDGVVFQKDLGPDTATRAAALVRYDPDLTWTRVDITENQSGSH